MGLFKALFSLIVLQCVRYVNADVTDNYNVTSVVGYFPWIPKGSSKLPLFCPDRCKDQDSEGDIETCCACSAGPCWDLSDDTTAGCDVNITQLQVEVTDVFFTSPILTTRSVILTPTIYTLVHQNHYIKALPVNICDFPTLYSVKLSNNHIINISNISCLGELQILDLSYNRISVVSNKTFTHNGKLRILNLSHNRLQKVEANMEKTLSGPILTADFSNNPLEYVDMTTLFIEAATFCVRNFSGAVFDYTNDSGFHASENAVFGPGHMDVRHTEMSLPNVSAIGLNVNELTRYQTDGTFYYGSSMSVGCDCTIGAWVVEIGSFWHDDTHIICEHPRDLAGVSFRQLATNSELADMMVCDVKENCPQKCRCTDVQSQHKVIVNCSGAGLTSFPHYMPIGAWNNNKLELILTNNSITSIPTRSYTDRLASLDLTGNPISEIEPDFFDTYPKTSPLDLSSMEMKALPYTIRSRFPSTIQFGSTPLNCDCSNTWISEWLSTYGDTGQLNCMVDGRMLPASVVTDDLLACDTSNNRVQFELFLINLFLIPILTAAILWKAFRPEMLVLQKRFNRRRSLDTKYDIFISFLSSENIECDTDYLSRSLMNYVYKDVRPALEKVGFKVVVPHLDINGDGMLIDISCAIADSKNYLIFFSEMYSINEESLSEFSRIWEAYSSNKDKDIVLVNFDGTENDEVKDRNIKAIFRVGRPLDFSERDTKLKDRIVKRCLQISKDRINYRRIQVQPQSANARQTTCM